MNGLELDPDAAVVYCGVAPSGIANDNSTHLGVRVLVVRKCRKVMLSDLIIQRQLLPAPLNPSCRFASSRKMSIGFSFPSASKCQ